MVVVIGRDHPFVVCQIMSQKYGILVYLLWSVKCVMDLWMLCQTAAGSTICGLASD